MILAVDHAGDHLRLAHRELEALPAHQLDEDGQLQLATALDLPGVGALGVQDPDRHVADQLGVQAVLQQAGRELLARLASQRGGVDADGHRDAGLVDGDHRQGARVLGVGQRLADGDVRDPSHGDDVARTGRLGGLALQRVGHQQLGDADPLLAAISAAQHERLALADRAVVHAADRQAAQVGRGVQVGHVGLQRHLVVVLGGRHGAQDRLEQRDEVLGIGHAAVLGAVQRCAPGARRGVDDREVDLVGGGIEVEEQLVGLVDDLGDARVGAVDLVDHEDDRQVLLQRLAQDEAGLGQRTLGGVDQQQHGVDHLQAALHLAAEVGVAGGVDDVDRDPALGRPDPW